MNYELKSKWINALRSGEFKQCKQAFRANPDIEGVYGSFCGTGVLLYITDSFGTGKHLSLALDKLLTGEERLTIYTMNDAGNSFPQLADWIEENIPAEVGVSENQPLNEPVKELAHGE